MSSVCLYYFVLTNIGGVWLASKANYNFLTQDKSSCAGVNMIKQKLAFEKQYECFWVKRDS